MLAIVTAGTLAWSLMQSGNRLPAETPTSTRTVDFTQRYRIAVHYLQTHRYQLAAAAFDDLQRLAPAVPEVWINLGFAMLGLDRPAAARDAFHAALALRPAQANAYWGLAVSLERLCRRQGAIAAMRTFVHLTDNTSPYRRRARAALWEWENSSQCVDTN